MSDQSQPKDDFTTALNALGEKGDIATIKFKIGPQKTSLILVSEGLVFLTIPRDGLDTFRGAVQESGLTGAGTLADNIKKVSLAMNLQRSP